MRYISTFSGIGGMDLALDRAGMTCVAQVEIDLQCRQVLERHWPDVPKFEDICNFGENDVDEPVDLIAGGFPCQDLSVAGRRAGLAGERSGLFFEFHRVVAQLRPQWVLLENVPGLLNSHKGLDFALVLGGLTGIVPDVPARGWGNAGLARGPIYNVAYRVLDARHFGVPQRRRRVFIVASLRGGPSPLEVLFESESLRRHPQESRKARASAAADASGGAGSGGVAATLNSGGNRGGFRTEPGEHLIAQEQGGYGTRTFMDEAPTLQSEEGTHQGGPSKLPMVVAHPDPAYAVSGVGTKFGSGRHNQDTFVVQQNGSDVQVNDEPGALTAGSARQTSGPIVFQQNQREEVRNMGDAVGALAADAGAHQQNFIAFAWQQGDDSNSPSNAGKGKGRSYITRAGDYAGSISATRTDAVAFQSSQSGVREVEEHATLDANNGSRRQNGVVGNFGVRRLTPVECARLQNFPDDWNEGLSDSVRYRQYGNAVCVAVVEWIAHRLVKEHQEREGT